MWHFEVKRSGVKVTSLTKLRPEWSPRPTRRDLEVAGVSYIVSVVGQHISLRTFNPLKRSGIIYKSGQCHPGLTYIF